jgi:hypothetical protein
VLINLEIQIHTQIDRLAKAGLLYQVVNRHGIRALTQSR